MKRIRNYGNLKLTAVKNFKGEDKLIDYFIITEQNEKLYAFSKVYTHNTYNLCKGGIRIEALKSKKTKDSGISRLVKYMNYMMGYLVEYYNLNAA